MIASPNIYIANYPHLGPLQITIDGNNSTVVSLLGMRKLSFSKFPKQRDNRHAIIRYSLKTYFSCFFRQVEHTKSVKNYKKSFMSIILENLAIQLSLGSKAKSKIETLKDKIYENLELYDWQDISNFFEIKNSEYCIEALIIPELVYLDKTIKIDSLKSKTHLITDCEVNLCKGESEKNSF